MHLGGEVLPDCGVHFQAVQGQEGLEADKNKFAGLCTVQVLTRRASSPEGEKEVELRLQRGGPTAHAGEGMLRPYPHLEVPGEVWVGKTLWTMVVMKQKY